MAFPLAHPAAVLPLRRLCPQWLSFPALIIGSLTPDAGYLFEKWKLDDFSHTLLGSIAFCLPLGLLTMLAFCALRWHLVKLLPPPYRDALAPSGRKPCVPLFAIVVSLLIGAWTHLLWDSCTHKDGWFVERIPMMQATVFTMRHRTARVCNVVWYASSFVGLIWLVLAFEKWKQGRVLGGARVPAGVVLRDAALVAALLVPMELAHHLLSGWEPALYVGAALCALLGIVIPLRLRKAHGAALPSPPAAERPDSV
jgi:hypothetical protein